MSLVRCSALIWCVLVSGCTVGNVNFTGEEGDDTNPPPPGDMNDDDNMAPGQAETLNVAFETLEIGGVYAPQNIVAIWIEDANGDFVQTLGRWAGVRARHLVSWAEASGQDMDAVSGATRISHDGELEASWDIGADVPDGMYTIRVEVSEQNAVSPEENTQASFPFDKNGVQDVQELTGQGLEIIEWDYSGRN